MRSSKSGPKFLHIQLGWEGWNVKERTDFSGRRRIIFLIIIPGIILMMMMSTLATTTATEMVMGGRAGQNELVGRRAEVIR